MEIQEYRDDSVVQGWAAETSMKHERVKKSPLNISTGEGNARINTIIISFLTIILAILRRRATAKYDPMRLRNSMTRKANPKNIIRSNCAAVWKVRDAMADSVTQAMNSHETAAARILSVIIIHQGGSLPPMMHSIWHDEI